MRRLIWLLLAVALAIGVWTVLPSAVVRRQLASILQERLQAAGPLTVHARATALGLLRGQVDHVTVSAAAVRMGEMTTQQLTAEFRGLRFSRARGGAVDIAGVESGVAELRVGQADLEEYLRQRGVENPTVTIDEATITVTGNLRAGPVLAPARLTGQFVVAQKTDLLFSVESLDVSGLSIPGQLVTAILGGADRPIISLRRLPVPVVIDRVTSAPGRVLVTARVEPAP